MKMPKNIIILWFSFNSYLGITQTLTLEFCIKQATTKNPDIQLQRYTRDLSASQINIAKSSALPRMSVDVFQSGNFGRSIDRFTNSYIDQFYNTSYAGLNFSMPIFTSFKIKNQINAAKLNLEASEKKIEQELNTLKMEIITTYLTALSNKEIIENFSKQLKSDSIQLLRVLKRKEAGLTSKIDDLQIQTLISNNQISRDDAILSYRLSLISLSQLINFEYNENMTLTSLEPGELLEINLDENKLNEMPELKELMIKNLAQDAMIKSIRADNLPSITLSGNYGAFYASSNQQRNFSQQINDTRNGGVSLGLNIPILGSLQNKANMESQKIQKKINEAAIEKIKTVLKREAIFSIETYKAILQKYENSKLLLKIAKENTDLIASQLDAGVTTMVEYITANNNMEKAANSASQTKYQLILQEILVKFYTTGTFTFN